MTATDIAQIMDIERESFPTMWPQTAYRRELENKVARYYVIAEAPEDEPPAREPQQPGIIRAIRRIVGAGDESNERVLGFIGLWLLAGDAHVVTLAVRESSRRQGMGERLLIAALDTAIEYDQEVLTLEVRRSNDPAQRLYEKYGLNRIGLRKRYYTDNNEDAVIMTSPDLRARSYRDRIDALRAAHQQAHPHLWM